MFIQFQLRLLFCRESCVLRKTNASMSKVCLARINAASPGQITSAHAEREQSIADIPAVSDLVVR